jgi:hypothetical protein
VRETNKIVYCVVRKKRGKKHIEEVRLIPYEEFGLWKFFISKQYGFTVLSEDMYLWLPQKDYLKRENLYSRIESLPARKVTLYFFLKPDGILVPVTRFFLQSDYANIKPVFLKHFKEFEDEHHTTKVLDHMTEDDGFCIRSSPSARKPSKQTLPPLE